MQLRLLPARVIVAGLAFVSVVQPRPGDCSQEKRDRARSAALTLPEPQVKTATSYTIRGKVSYYGIEFAGRKTSNGELFDPSILTMAHKTLPFGTMVRVTNLQNSKSVVVRVNDRGPYIRDRVGDMSASAARVLGMVQSGVVDARLEVITV